MAPRQPEQRDTDAPRSARSHVDHLYGGERDAWPSNAGRCHELHADELISWFAERQRGTVSHAQLRAAGVTPRQIERRVGSGHLRPLHRGVFAAGHRALPPLGREAAAVLAVGSGAVLSHGSAAAVWKLLPAHPSGPVEVLVSGNRRSRPGIAVHRTANLPPSDVRSHRGLAVTSPARVVLDLASRLGATALERLVAEALAIDPGAQGQLARRGTRRVRALVHAAPRRTRSRPERRLLGLVRTAGLPVPQTNVRVAGHEVDALWARHRLAVEVDTYATHGDRVAFERDRRRDLDLRAAGFATVRISDRQLDETPTAVVATLAQALARAAA